MENGKHTYQEIFNQVAAARQALELIQAGRKELSVLGDGVYSQTLFTGCGSTYYLSLSSAALFQELTGKPARAVTGGELLYNPQTVLTAGRTLLIAISRSGSTTETVRATEQFRREKRGDVIVITNYGDQPLAQLADFAIVIDQGQEKSVAQTGSFSSMFVAVTALCALFAGRQDLLDSMSLLPQVMDRLLRDYQLKARQLGQDLNLDRFYFLGSGLRYGLACEVNLKMKEMTLTHSEPFHFMEFRHGPMSMVTNSSVVVGMLSDVNRVHEQKVLKEMEKLGANIFSLAETDASVEFHSQVPEVVRGVLYLPVLQLMAYYRSIQKGLDPDNPANLTAVVMLE